ncbi:hypothetical protein [Leucobacter musarum]|uniref:hypothetical protein n=1 Tax=Leucobacter musarum TaxID=1930747 RepID=UPI0006A795B6|nr:hypothetical protein [Leucobacter musarum]
MQTGNSSQRQAHSLSLHESGASVIVLASPQPNLGRRSDQAGEADRGKLSNVDEVRKLLAAALEDEASARKAFNTDVNTAHTAFQDFVTARRKYCETIGNHTHLLIDAGIPIEGAELDGEPIELRGGSQPGETILRAMNNSITCERAPKISHWLNKNS